MADSPYIAPALEASLGVRRQVTFQAMRVFSGWGYREVQVPLIDYFDSLKRALDPDATERSFRFVDRHGNVMILRTDVTPSIAKLAAYQIESAAARLPMRVSYANKTVRIDRGHDGRASETYQLGIELIGVPTLAGDIENFLVALECLDRLGLEDYQFNVTDHGIARHLLNATGAPQRIREEVHEAITARDPTGIRSILGELGARERFIEAVSTLADFEGGLHQLSRLQELLPDDKVLHQRLGRIRNLFTTLSALGYRDRIRIDIAELGGASYYTGIAFNIVSEVAGRSLGRGGRYDDLLAAFNQKQPAVGFSLTTEALVDALQPTDIDMPSTRAMSDAVVVGESLVDAFQEAINRRLENRPTRIVSERS